MIQELREQRPVGPPASELRAVFSMSSEVFGCAEIRIEEDRETNDVFYVVDVVADGDDEQVFAASDMWHDRMACELHDRIGRYALNIEFRQ